MPSTTWKKSPPELAERFAAALPAHADLVRKPMFGYPAAFVHGNMMGSLFQDRVVVRLGKEGAEAAVADGAAEPFTPMAGRTMTGYVLLHAQDAEDPARLATWLARALEFTLTLPKKSAAGKKASAAKKAAASKKVPAKKAAPAKRKPA